MGAEFRETYIALTKAAQIATKAYNAVPHTADLEEAMYASYDAVGRFLEEHGLAFHQTGKRFHLKGEARI
jgi:hypothetical protein